MIRLLKFTVFILLISFFSQSCFAEDSFQEAKKNIKVLYNTNKLKEAYQLISRMDENMRDAEIWLLAANITQDYGRDLDTIYLLQKSISSDRKYYKAYYNLGNIYLKEKKYNSAIYNYKQSVRYNQNFAYGWYNMGNAYFLLEDYKRAKSSYKKAISILNNDADFYYNLALTYKQLNKPKQAQKMLDVYNKLKNNVN